MKIVGAGAAGLSLALMARGPVEIVERSDRPGGLCRSTVIEGFTFDTGPHILGGIPDAVEWVRWSTGIEWVQGRTRNVGWVDGRAVPHPFEDPAMGARYMAKMWKTPVDELSTGGLGAQRGRKPGGVSTFWYPKTGGYQAITDAWASRLDITYNTAGEREPGTVWTAPRHGARYNTLVTVTAGFRGTAPDLTAVYLPESWTPFHRLSFPSAFAPGNAPEGCYSIQGEASFDYPVQEGLPHAFRTTLAALGLGGERVFEHLRVVPYAYPVPTDPEPPEPRQNAPQVVEHGRTGAHRYLNLDGVVAMSMRLAASLR